MKHTAGLAALAALTVVGFAPATALSPGRALADTATAAAQAPLWVTHQYVGGAGVNGQVAASPDGSDGAQAAGMSPDGASVYITGSAAGSARNSVNYTTIAYHTATGQKVWLVRYVGPRNFDFANALAVSPTGNGVFVTGFIGVHDGCCNFGTVAYQP